MPLLNPHNNPTAPLQPILPLISHLPLPPSPLKRYEAGSGYLLFILTVSEDNEGVDGDRLVSEDDDRIYIDLLYRIVL